MENDVSGIEFHEKLAAEWDDRYRSGSFRRRADLFRNHLLPLVPEGGQWLDAGCGSGYFCRILAQNQANVVGLDASKSMILHARSHATAAGLEERLSFREVETIEDISFGDASFDGCICLSVLEYLANPLGCLDEIVRTLKTGGYLIISLPHRRSVVRSAQNVMRSASGSTENIALDYLVSSKFSITPKNLQIEFDKRGLKTVKLVGFDAIIPEKLHRLLPPSLIYIVGRKIERVHFG